jgi:hypothetical protein
MPCHVDVLTQARYFHLFISSMIECDDHYHGIGLWKDFPLIHKVPFAKVVARLAWMSANPLFSHNMW